jgi:hypothetical protein
MAILKTLARKKRWLPVGTTYTLRAGAAAVLALAFGSHTLAQVDVRAKQPVQDQIQIQKALQPRLLQLPQAPAPTNLSVEPQNPGLHRLRWQAPAGSQFR